MIDISISKYVRERLWWNICELHILLLHVISSDRWPDKMVLDKMVAISIDSNSTELNFYSVTTSHK